MPRNSLSSFLCTKIVRSSVFYTSLFCGAATLFSEQKADAFGHSSPLSVEHFARGTGMALWVATVPDTAFAQLDASAVLARFAVGNGNSLVVYRGAPAFDIRSAGRMFHLQAGQVLTYVESVGPRNGFSLIAGNMRAGLAVIQPAQYKNLAKFPSVFVDAIPLDGSSSPARRLNVRPRDAVTFVQRPFFVTAGLPQVIQNERVENELKAFSGAIPLPDGTRIAERGTEAGKVRARSHLVSSFRALGLDASEKCYGRSGCNVEATLWGKDRTNLMLFTSHLDSMTNAGADDNGTGTVVLLEAARVLAAQGMRARSIRFVAFDQEELGLVGSRAYVKGLNADERKMIRGAVNMDMLGYDGDGDGAFHAIDCERADSQFLKQALVKLNQTSAQPLKVVNACTNRSDHASFWNAGIPAIVLSENFFGGDSNPCYHQACDKVDKITFPYYFRLANLVVNLAAAVAAE